MFRSPTFVLAWLTSFLAGVYALGGGWAQGDAINVFSLPSGQTSLSFVTVGDPGNAPDSTGYGSVGYTYQIGTFDITSSQYCAMLNAIAQTDQFGLYNPTMNPGDGIGSPGIIRSGSSGSYSYTVASGYQNFPVTEVSWGSAARFCNWLANGQPSTGAETSATTEDGSYALNGAVTDAQLNAATRSPSATYVIPTENEWYKAAYYSPFLDGTGGYFVYPTQSNTAPSNILDASGTNNANFKDPTLGFTNPGFGLTPVGSFLDSASPWGGFDFGGDVDQWNEGDLIGRGIWGGSWAAGSALEESGPLSLGIGSPTGESPTIGFRVAVVPEPSATALLAVGAIGLLRRRRRERR